MSKLDFSRPVDVGGNMPKISTLLKMVMIAMAVTALALVLLALFITYGPVSEEAAEGCVTAATVISIFVAGFMVSRKGKSRGWLNGIIAGLLYIMLMLIIGFLAFGNFSLGTDAMKVMILGVIAGAVGGIFGINFRKRK